MKLLYDTPQTKLPDKMKALPATTHPKQNKTRPRHTNALPTGIKDAQFFYFFNGVKDSFMF